MNNFNIKNVKWFILGAALTSNIRFFTGEGNTNKKFVTNLSADGSKLILRSGSSGNRKT